MLSAEPPQIVFELPPVCAEGEGASVLFSSSIASSRAPEPGWEVRVNVAGRAGHRTATAALVDPRGTAVARRSFTTDGAACAPLARAIGLWASLALDDETSRHRSDAEAAPPRTEARADSRPEPPPPATDFWPLPAVKEPPLPEQDLFLRHPESSRSGELGMSFFLMSVGPETLAGPTVFGVAELNGGFFLRPALAYGRDTDGFSGARSEATGSWWAARVDGCGRIPGLYHERRGMQLDLCAGSEGGLLYGAPYLAVGPALGLRGELGGNLSVELLGTGLWELLREPFADEHEGYRKVDHFAERIELAISWRVR